MFPTPKLFAAVLFLALFSAPSRAQEEQRCSERQTPGFICLNCDVLGYCLNRNGEWDTIRVESCNSADGFFCNSMLQSCSNSTGPCNPFLGAFICTSVGLFPDPFDCQVYHMCYRNGPSFIAVSHNCGPGAAFNPAQGECSLKPDDELCSRYWFTCNKAGDSGVWPMNPNIFYMCIFAQQEGVLFPSMFRCPPNEVFVDGFCVDKETPEKPEFVCTSTGLFPDQRNCRAYFFCNFELEAERLLCPEGTYFSERTQACVLGTC